MKDDMNTKNKINTNNDVNTEANTNEEDNTDRNNNISRVYEDDMFSFSFLGGFAGLIIWGVTGKQSGFVGLYILLGIIAGILGLICLLLNEQFNKS